VPSALVTGGSSGIGLAVARMLRDEGFALTLVARRPERLAAAAAELGASSLAADVRDAERCEAIVAAHVAEHAGLDVLVNAAGVGVAGPIEEQQVKWIDLQLDVNLRGVILVTRAALPHLKAAHGLVVNVASVAGTRPVPELPVYGATKAGVVSLTHSLSTALDEHGVRVHALCPGFVDTPMAAYSGLPGDELIRPEDCAEVVRMLLRLSPRALVPEVVIERSGAAGEA
jgi:NADP-dependent 3-hydroxy acid dehydrogenase YdfG